MPLFGGAEAAGAPAAGVVLARNDSGAACDAGCPVSITQVLEAGRTRCGLAAFALPAAEPYGILLESIGAGAIGPVALTGGPWQVLVQGLIAPGYRLEPTQGEPYAEERDGGPLMALSAPDEHGLCWVVFAAGGGGGIEIRDDDPPAADLFDGRIWYNRSAG